MSINFKWNLEKNKSLMKDRGVCFEDVVITIYEDKIIDTLLNFFSGFMLDN